MDEQPVCKCGTRCPVFVKLVAWLMMFSVVPGLLIAVISLGGRGTGLEYDWLIAGVWSLVYMTAIVTAFKLLSGHRWAFQVAFLLTLPTAILPILLLLQHRDYDDYVAYQQRRTARARWSEP